MTANIWPIRGLGQLVVCGQSAQVLGLWVAFLGAYLRHIAELEGSLTRGSQAARGVYQPFPFVSNVGSWGLAPPQCTVLL